MADDGLPSVLIAAPSYAGKSYALDRWVESTNAIRAAYGGRSDTLIVDNTRNSDGYTKLCIEKGIRCVHLDPLVTFESTFSRCWQIIHQEAVIEEFDWVFSVEADNIMPPEALVKLMAIADAGRLEVVTHTYPLHLLDAAKKGRTPTMKKDRFMYNELGCCLMSTRLLGLGLADRSRYDNFTLALFNSANKYLTGWATACKLWQSEHLDGYEQEFQQFWNTPDNDGRWNPYEDMKDDFDYAAHLPECIREDYERQGKGIALAMTPGTYEAKANGQVIKPDGTVITPDGKRIINAAVPAEAAGDNGNGNVALGSKV